MAWDLAGFTASLTGLSVHTRRAYEHDVAEFVAWAERGGCPEPADADHRALRRYLAYLGTRGFATRSAPARPPRPPKGDARLPRVPRRDEATAMLDGAADRVGASTDDGPLAL